MLVASLLVAAPARGAQWTPVQDVSAPGWTGSDSPRAAVDRDGDTLLVWPATCPECFSSQIQARISPADGGPLGPILTLTEHGASASWPEVGVDDDGDAAVVWEHEDAVVGRRISATGEVGPMVTLSGAQAGSPQVAVDPNGTALVAWTQYADGAYTAYARHFGIGGTVGPLWTLGASSVDSPVVAVDRTGTAVVVWSTPDWGRLLARRITAAAMSEPVLVDSPVGEMSGVAGPSVAVDADGDAVIAYRPVFNRSTAGLRARWFAADGTLGPVLAVAPADHSVTFYSTVDVDLEGDAVVAWSRHTRGVLTDAYARTIPRTGAPGPVTAFGQGDRPRVALDDDGDGIVTFTAPGPSWAYNGVSASTVGRDGTFAPVEQLSAEGKTARVDVGPTGRFSVIWQCGPYPYTIQARFGA
ncbi:hypothetical protein Val02_09890 [Virgisporangium aliadipatigenens]|uniref:Uncharacterized protein n=1 Tax=Virgisporangium aliadipatigenens TaxID=741659 RepID=A0A8J3YH49_9ACTN|nr:hypothetical protein Val02_09890 [Virgisporangium aliadipatigenens]